MESHIPPAADLTLPPAWALADVPGLERGQQPRSLTRLEGGSVNQVWRIDSAAGSFVLRLDGAAWRRPGVDRTREFALHQVAAAAGIAPAIVRARPEAQGLLIMEYLHGRSWTAEDYADVLALRRLGERLQVLHQLPVPAVQTFDPWRVAQAYIECIQAPFGALPATALQRLKSSCSELEHNPSNLSVVHGDLWQGNLLEGTQLWLLDWEYAQRSDPLMDVACVLAYYPSALRYRAELAAAAGFEQPIWDEALSTRVYIYRALAWLWHLARGEQASPP